MLIVLDIETTGISPIKNCMVSLGAVDFDSEREFYQECHIYDDSEVTPIALEINGFNESQIRDQIKSPAHEAYFDFQEWAAKLNSDQNQKIILAGHNIGHFDILFLEELAKYFHNHKFPFSYRTIDTHTLGYAVFGESLTLDGIGAKFGIEKEPKPHNALTGAKYCKKVLSLLVDKVKNK